MSNHYCWECHRQAYPDSTPQYVSRPCRGEYVTQVCRGSGVPEGDSAVGYNNWAAGHKYGNGWGNEAYCRDTCFQRDCRSFHGGYSSVLPEVTFEPRLDGEVMKRTHQMGHIPVVHCSTDGSFSMTNQDYWRGFHNRQGFPTSTAKYPATSGVEYLHESCCRQGPTVDFENDATSSRAFRKDQTQAANAEYYNRTSGCGSEALGRTSSYRYDQGSSDGSNSSMFMEITDAPTLDGEVRKRIDQMDCMPHVPKINCRIPSADEATSDHERLLNRLELYDLHELKVSGDGNCQFRALSDQLYQTSEYHKEVRQQVVDQLKANPDVYAPYVPMPYHEYLTKISTLGEWGDHVTLQAAADCYGVRIFVLTSYKDTCYIEILPRQKKSEKVIFLSFWAEVHYNSIYSKEESYSHMSEPNRKKKCWNLMTQFQKK